MLHQNNGGMQNPQSVGALSNADQLPALIEQPDERGSKKETRIANP